LTVRLNAGPAAVAELGLKLVRERVEDAATTETLTVTPTDVPELPDTLSVNVPEVLVPTAKLEPLRFAVTVSVRGAALETA